MRAVNKLTGLNLAAKLCCSTLCLLASLSLCAADMPYKGEAYYKTNAIQQLTQIEDSLNFLVLGDWGKNGHYSQRQVADKMDIAMDNLDGDFIISTGDNFYPNGIASVNDPYWQTSFEQVYSGPNLFEPWYIVLGNHDYRGNAQAQIDYSQISQRWTLPSRYYSKSFVLDDNQPEQSLLIVFLDTNPFEASYQTETKYLSTQSQDKAAQLAWLKQTLAGSSAKWKIVVGHHPMYSSGKRYGKTDSIRAVFEPILEKYKVDAYFAGHEHDLQHNQIKGKRLAHFVSGAGAVTRPVKQREFTHFAQATAGFIAVSVNVKQINVQMISHLGDVIYQTQIVK